MLSARDFEADEIQCRSHYQQEYAKRQAAAKTDDVRAKQKEEADPHKEAREYCVQRRAAVASEYQGNIARWAAGVGFVALVAAAAAAFAAIRTVRIMQSTAQRQLRAYVFVRNVHVSGFPDGDKIEVTFQVQNFGATPAYKVTAAQRVFLGDYPVPVGSVAPDRPPTLIADLGPSAPFSQRSPCRKLTADEVEAVKAKKRALYFTAAVSYVDAFGRTQTTEPLRYKGGDSIDGTSMNYFGDRNRAT